MKLYRTSHACHRDDVRSYRYWIADENKSKLVHIGICDIDSSFMKMLMSAAEIDYIELNILDDEFKKLMLNEGYEQ